MSPYSCVDGLGLCPIAPDSNNRPAGSRPRFINSLFSTLYCGSRLVWHLGNYQVTVKVVEYGAAVGMTEN